MGQAAWLGVRRNPPEVERIAGIVRREITAGMTGPGEWLWEQGIAMRHDCTCNTARSALAAIRREGLARCRDRHYYAITCPATLEAASARMGEVLALFRRASRMTTPQLAAAIAPPEETPQARGRFTRRWSADITAAEAGAWQPAFFWGSCDDGLNAAGMLRRIHDYEYTPPGTTRE